MKTIIYQRIEGMFTLILNTIIHFLTLHIPIVKIENPTFDFYPLLDYIVKEISLGVFQYLLIKAAIDI